MIMSMQHPFERGGFGKPPFRVTGFSEETYQACPGAPVQPGTSCDHCGTGIRYVVHIKSADGQAFKIGTDCALTQLGKESNINPADRKMADSIKVSVNKRKAKMAKAAKLARIARGKELLATNRAAFAGLPHVNEKLAARGLTLADYLDWMFDRAGAQGRVKACQIIERTLEA
jgi:hypothetical protein